MYLKIQFKHNMFQIILSLLIEIRHQALEDFIRKGYVIIHWLLSQHPSLKKYIACYLIMVILFRPRMSLDSIRQNKNHLKFLCNCLF